MLLKILASASQATRIPPPPADLHAQIDLMSIKLKAKIYVEACIESHREKKYLSYYPYRYLYEVCTYIYCTRYMHMYYLNLSTSKDPGLPLPSDAALSTRNKKLRRLKTTSSLRTEYNPA